MYVGYGIFIGIVYKLAKDETQSVLFKNQVRTAQ